LLCVLVHHALVAVEGLAIPEIEYPTAFSRYKSSFDVTPLSVHVYEVVEWVVNINANALLELELKV